MDSILIKPCVSPQVFYGGRRVAGSATGLEPSGQPLAPTRWCVGEEACIRDGDAERFVSAGSRLIRTVANEGFFRSTQRLPGMVGASMDTVEQVDTALGATRRI